MIKSILIIILAFIPMLNAFPQEEKINVVIFGSHPDDADKQAGGDSCRISEKRP